VDLHRGRISVRSEGEGLGCTFTVDLPVYSYRGPTARNSRIYHSRSVHIPSSNLESSNNRNGNESARVQIAGNSRNNLSNIINPNSTTCVNEARRSSQLHQEVFGSVARPFFAPTPPEGILCRTRHQNHSPQSYQESDSLDRTGGSEIDVHMSVSRHSDTLIIHRNGRTDNRSAVVPSPAEISIRVLVVDDAGLNRKMMCRLLKGYCESVGEAYDGQDALAKVRLGEEENRPYNVILMDYQMPNLDGPGAARQLRSNGYVGLIIGITGMTAGTDMEEFRAAGADCVLTKPVNTQDLEPIFQGE